MHHPMKFAAEKFHLSSIRSAESAVGLDKRQEHDQLYQQQR